MKTKVIEKRLDRFGYITICCAILYFGIHLIIAN